MFNTVNDRLNALGVCSRVGVSSVIYSISDKSESLSNTPFPIVRCISLYLELLSDEREDRTSVIAMVALTITRPELRNLASGAM